MNITEAIKSGRPFRREGWPSYMSELRDRGRGAFYVHDNGTEADGGPDSEDILADDWELKEPDAKDRFDQALAAALKDSFGVCADQKVQGGLSSFEFDVLIISLRNRLGMEA